jgi:cytochrome P450 family 135
MGRYSALASHDAGAELETGRTSYPPGPTAPALVQTYQWIFRPTQFMEDCFSRHGPMFTARLRGFDNLGTSTVVFIADPAAVKDVLTGGPELAHVGSSRESMQLILGSRSLLLLDGAEHLRHRRLVNPPLHGERLVRHGGAIAEITRREVASWPVGRTFALLPRMIDVAVQVILRAVFGLDEGERSRELRHRVLRFAHSAMTLKAELLMALPRRMGPLNLRAGLERERAELDAALQAEVARRRSDPEALRDRDDVLSLLLQARDESGRPMSAEELNDDLVTLLLGGHESTAAALTWCFEHLLRTPRALQRLTDECEREGSGGSYLDAVVSETLRLRAPFPIFTRNLPVACEVGGYRLPAGTSLVACLYLLHRRADLYADPLAFRPERFLEEPPDRYAYAPFGGGPRRCVGDRLAVFEMKTVVATILRHARLAVASDRPDHARRRMIVLAPGRGTRVVLRERRGLS